MQALDLAGQASHLVADLLLQKVHLVPQAAELVVGRHPVHLCRRLHLLQDLANPANYLLGQGLHGRSYIAQQVLSHVCELSPSYSEHLLAQAGGLLAEALLADPEEVVEGHVADKAPLLVQARRLVLLQLGRRVEGVRSRGVVAPRVLLRVVLIGRKRIAAFPRALLAGRLWRPLRGRARGGDGLLPLVRRRLPQVPQRIQWLRLLRDHLLDHAASC
mmetsp:Transcript_85933/g.251560  ORF Transcript_85933/g.251560 Transcript_85933/m.251560 type:complete len:217 (+) Transcript_85933:2020-2670(+)